MLEIKDNLISEGQSIRDAMGVIERSKAKVALVVGEGRHLLGSVTDGDIRRAILRGVDLEDAVITIMNTNPHVANVKDDRSFLLDLMRNNICRHVPVVDDDGQVIAIETLEELIGQPQHDNWVMLLAGGLGKRLRPLTEECPKPMLPVGDRPILEHIIIALKHQGFRNFIVSLNYLGHMIEDYFGDGERFGVNIKYTLEEEPLGTAGPLSLLKEKPKLPMLVMNGDILTKVDFNHLLAFHGEHDALATMCVRDYTIEVPFGVVNINGQYISSLIEKPTQKFLVNAGIYVLSPGALDIIPSGTRYDMPALFADMMEKNLPTAAFPVQEYWIDVGRIDDFQQANSDAELAMRPVSGESRA